MISLQTKISIWNTSSFVLWWHKLTLFPTTGFTIRTKLCNDWIGNNVRVDQYNLMPSPKQSQSPLQTELSSFPLNWGGKATTLSVWEIETMGDWNRVYRFRISRITCYGSWVLRCFTYTLWNTKNSAVLIDAFCMWTHHTLCMHLN